MSEVKSPMAGTVFELIAAIGAAVEEGDELVILESMKMEIPVEAPSDGTVADIHIAQGDQVQEGDLLVTLSD